MKNILILILTITCLTSCYSHQYPNGDGTMTVVEHNIFKSDSTVLYNVKMPINHKGVIISEDRGSHLVGVPGKGGHYVTHYDIKIKYTNYKGELKIYKDRISRSEYNNYLRRGYPIIRERFYPSYKVYPIY